MILYVLIAILPVIALPIGEFAKKKNTFHFKLTVANVSLNTLTIRGPVKVAQRDAIYV